MTYPAVDTSVIIRLLSGDDLQKQQRCQALFEQIEQGTVAVAAPVTVIADAVYVLSSSRLYNQSREQVAQLLTPLVRLPAFHVQARSAVLAALHLYGATPHLDFGDAFLAASLLQAGSAHVYSYDTDFDRLPGIPRLEP